MKNIFIGLIATNSKHNDIKNHSLEIASCSNNLQVGRLGTHDVELDDIQTQEMDLR